MDKPIRSVECLCCEERGNCIVAQAEAVLPESLADAGLSWNSGALGPPVVAPAPTLP
jgi:hypothetical protein